MIDANVFIYALGEDHRYREPCRTLVAALARGEFAAEISTEIVQEVVHVRRRRLLAGDDALDRGREMLSWGLPVHDFTATDLTVALELLRGRPALPVRDAVHAATAANREIAVIVSTDRDFDELSQIERIDPAAEGAFERLTA